jgi:hypothetical protein
MSESQIINGLHRGHGLSFAGGSTLHFVNFIPTINNNVRSDILLPRVRSASAVPIKKQS